MARYRIYFLDQGAAIETGVDYDGHTDEAAMEHAARLARCGSQTEIWAGARYLGRVTGCRTTNRSLLVTEQVRRTREHVRASITRIEACRQGRSKTIEMIALGYERLALARRRG